MTKRDDIKREENLNGKAGCSGKGYDFDHDRIGSFDTGHLFFCGG